MLASLHASAILVLSIITSSISSPLPLPTISTSSSDVSNSVSNGVDDGVSNSTHSGTNPMCSRFTCCVANFMAAPCCYMARNPECCECWERRGNRNRDPVVVIAPQEGPQGHSAVVLRTSNTNFPASRIGGNGVDQTEDDSGPFGFLSWYNGHRTGPETARDNSGPTRASTRADDIGDALVSSSSFSEPQHEALVMPHAPAEEFEARSNGKQNTEVKLDVNAGTLPNVLPASVESSPSMMKAEASEQVTTIVSFNPLETPKADESSEPVAVIEAKPLAPEDDPIALLNLTLDKTEPDVTRPDGLEESESQPERSDIEGGVAEPGSEYAPLPEPSPAADELQNTEAVEGETKTNTAPNDDVPFVVTSEVASDAGTPEKDAPIAEEEKLLEIKAVAPEVPATVEEKTLDEVLAQFLPKEQPQDEASLAVADKRDELIINDDIQQDAPFSSLEAIEDASPLPVEQLFKEHKITELKVEKIPAKEENKVPDEAQVPDQKQTSVKNEEKKVGIEERREGENEEVKEVITAKEAPKLTSETVEEARTDKTEVKAAAVESEAQAEPEPSSDVETESRAEPEPTSNVETESRAEPEPTSNVETEPRAEPEPSSDIDTEPRAEPEPSSDVVTEPRAEPEPSSAVVSEPQAEPEPSQETKSEPQADPQPTLNLGSEPKAEPEPTSNVENKEVPAKEEKEIAKDPIEANKSTNEGENKKTESIPEQHPTSNAEAAVPEPTNEDKPEKRDETSEPKEKSQAESAPKDDKKEMIAEKMANTTDKAAESDVKKVSQMPDNPNKMKEDDAPLDDAKKVEVSGNVSLSSPEKAPQPETPANSGNVKTSDPVVDVWKNADEVEEKNENMTDDERTESITTTEETTTTSTTVATTSEATTSPSSTTTAEISSTTPRVTSTTEGLKAVPVAAIVTRRSSNYDQYRRAPSFWVVIDKRRSKKQP